MKRCRGILDRPVKPGDDKNKMERAPMHEASVVFFIPPLDGEGGEPASVGSPGGVRRFPPPPTPRRASSDLPARGR